MSCAKHNFEIDQGATWSQVIKFLGSDISSYTARMQFRRTIGAADPADVEMTTGNGKISISFSAPDSTITLTLTDTETDALSDSYFYDLEIISGSSVVTRILEGKIIINPNVTR